MQPHYTIYSLKIFLATVGTLPKYEKVVLHPPLFAMIAAAGSYLLTVFTEILDRNFKFFVHLFVQDDHFISAAANMMHMPSETINDTLNYNWLTDGIDVNMSK